MKFLEWLGNCIKYLWMVWFAIIFYYYSDSGTSEQMEWLFVGGIAGVLGVGEFWYDKVNVKLDEILKLLNKE